MANFADDNSPNMQASNTKCLAGSIESTACRILKCFSDNQLKGNDDKCHVLLNTYKKRLQ